jgi:hypothetical protein
LDHQLVQTANFDTCIYQSNVPVGYRNIKPQQFSGSMLGIKELEGRCKCGEGARQEPIVGRERSRASGTYPDELCDKYARCVITQFVLMGKEEFLRYKEMRLKETITEHKAKAKKASSSSQEKASQRSSPAKAESAHRETRTKTEASESPDFDPSKSTSSTSSSSAGEDNGGDDGKGESLQPETVHTWAGGDGKFGMLKSRNIKSAAEDATYVGGMRDPYKAAQANPSLMSLGLRIRAAWETFVKQFPTAVKVAETHGTQHCAFNDKLVAEWKSKPKKLVGAQAPPSLSIKGRLEYKSPFDAEVLQAWAERGFDRETEVPKWIRNGAPLGIEEPIGTCGIFPKASSEDPYALAEAGDITNYKSVAET